MSEAKFFVYLLRRKDNNSVFYVGETACPERRFRQHMEGDTYRTHYVISRLKDSGIDVDMKIVGEFDSREKARKYEKELIDRAWRKNYWLVNDAILPNSPSLKRNGKRWSEKELQQLVHMYEVDHLTPAKIARALERSSGTVAAQLKRQGVVIQW